jgi:hypothetical protein
MFKKINLVRLQPKFIDLLTAYMKHADVDQKTLAKRLDINEGIISNLLHDKRKLSANYLMSFFFKGVFMPEQIYDGKAVDEREKEFWAAANLCHRSGLLHKIVTLESRGVNVEAVMEGLLIVHPDKG